VTTTTTSTSTDQHLAALNQAAFDLFNAAQDRSPDLVAHRACYYSARQALLDLGFSAAHLRNLTTVAFDRAHAARRA